MLPKTQLHECYIFSFIFFVHFFCSSKRNEPKKRAPEMTNLTRPYARYTNPPATGRVKFRTPDRSGQAISGLPAHPHLHSFADN
jgi:hypothetical protein